MDVSAGQMAVLAVLAGIWGGAVTVIGAWGTLRRPEVHHFYVGLLALYLSHALATFGAPLVIVDVFGLFGMGCIVDDAIQHFVQAVQLANGKPITFGSPVHTAYVWAARRFGIRRVVVGIALAALVLGAIGLTSCASTPRSPRELALAAQIPVTIDNRDVRDATVYVLAGGSVAFRLGRASALSTTALTLSAPFLHQAIQVAARFDGGGRPIVSDRFVVDAEGFTVILGRADANVFGGN